MNSEHPRGSLKGVPGSGSVVLRVGSMQSLHGSLRVSHMFSRKMKILLLLLIPDSTMKYSFIHYWECNWLNAYLLDSSVQQWFSLILIRQGCNASSKSHILTTFQLDLIYTVSVIGNVTGLIHSTIIKYAIKILHKINDYYNLINTHSFHFQLHCLMQFDFHIHMNA